MAKSRIEQAQMNIDYILAGMLNDLYDGNVDYYTEDEILDITYDGIFDIWVVSPGFVRVGDGICDDLKFLGKDTIIDLIKTADDFREILMYNA